MKHFLYTEFQKIYLMKKINFLSFVLLYSTSLIIAQNSSINYIEGEGISFLTNEGEYSFNIGGYIQPSYRSESLDGKLLSKDSDNIFMSKKSVFFLKGLMKNEKLSFMLSANFSSENPLDEAWVSYKINKSLSLFFGQMLSFTNNRELMFREDKIQMNDRSMLSSTFSNTGREFGFFIKTKLKSPIGLLVPMFALSSGDGINSFGNDSRDPDRGSFKFGGRLDLYPFGMFAENNDNSTVDFFGENELKVVFGLAASLNDGASNEVGEGHADFVLYDNLGLEDFPDFNQIYFDALLKYKRASLLIEYVDSYASDIDEIYTLNPIENGISNAILNPSEISKFLVIGDQLNIQLGYLSKSMVSFDLRYGKAIPEFLVENSILKKFENYSLGISKYINKNVKIQALYNRNKFELNEDNYAELLIQVSF